MSEEPLAPDSRPAPDAVPATPTGAGNAARTIALGTIVFAATLLLLLGASRLTEPPDPTPAAAASAAVAASSSASPAPASPAPASSPSPTATTASASPSAAAASASPSGDPVLVGAGDIGDCGEDGDEATANLLDEIQGTVVTLGDNAYSNGTAEQFLECYDPNWGRHLARTRPAPGNHDWGRDNLDGYFGYYGANATGPDGASWYSYDLGTWHVVVLDSMCEQVGGCDAGSAQLEWLTADLAASDASCTLAYWHHPRFSSGMHGNHRFVGPFWEVLYDADADVVLNGHDHDYERFAPQDPGGEEDRARGIREFVAGTGGTNLRRFEEPKPNSELRIDGVHGVIKFTLHDGSYDWEFIPTPADGDVSDRGTAKCH